MLTKRNLKKKRLYVFLMTIKFLYRNVIDICNNNNYINIDDTHLSTLNMIIALYFFLSNVFF